MADLIIHDMELPKILHGEPCYVDVRIFADGSVIMAKTAPPYYEKFEAIPLPEGHGRLGDLDALFEKMYHLSDNEGAHKDSHVDDDLILRDSACYLIEKATTIIEADLEWKMKNCCCFSNTDQAEGDKENG